MTANAITLGEMAISSVPGQPFPMSDRQRISIKFRRSSFWLRGLTGSPPALGCRFIAFPKATTRLVAGQISILEVVEYGFNRSRLSRSQCLKWAISGLSAAQQRVSLFDHIVG